MVLKENRLFFSICPAEEDISSPTPEPETSQKSPRCCTENSPEPTAATEPEPATIKEPALKRATEPNINTEPEHENTTEELLNIFEDNLIDWIREVVPSSPEPLLSPESPLVPSSSPVFPELSVTLKLPPSLPFPPPLMPASSSVLSPLVPASPSAHPQQAPSKHSDPPWDFQSPAPPTVGVRIPSLQVLDSTSVLQPIGSALAPGSLVSSMKQWRPEESPHMQIL
ncbi:proteoglycan 4-like [Cyprinus carpio]|uniref:Proteoglycan 4-like n=1 Tax=Cyprinus carpio TaxID=7962 RepID=A0A9Q9Z6X9_CYPCA|nr:proteoglycan 4-like [Cyprinus carpio]